MSSNDIDSLMKFAKDRINGIYNEDLITPDTTLRIVHDCYKDGQITEFLSYTFVGKKTVARDYTVNISIVERDDITY